METRTTRILQRLAGALYVVDGRPGQCCDGGPLDFAGDLLHRGKVSFGSDWKARFHDIYTETIQQVRHVHLFVRGHTASRGLFTIAQSCVEDRNSGGRHSGVLLSLLYFIYYSNDWQPISQAYNSYIFISLPMIIRFSYNHRSF